MQVTIDLPLNAKGWKIVPSKLGRIHGLPSTTGHLIAIQEQAGLCVIQTPTKQLVCHTDWFEKAKQKRGQATSKPARQTRSSRISADEY